MDVLHAPWRIQYILAPKPPRGAKSLFATIAESNEDEANYVIVRGRTCFALLNRYPYAAGHLMVVPYKQAADLNDLSEEELTELMVMIRRCVNALREVMRPDGFNIGVNLGKVAGAGVEDHLHVHIVPRWLGDTNFMPVIANTSVLSEALTETAAKLRAALNKANQSA